MTTYTVRTNAELRALGLSFYTLCKLAELLRCVDPRHNLEDRIARDGWKGELCLDELGNFVAFK